MRVLHIIPSAFNYFDDIRAEAFKLVETLNAMGVETDAYAMQFSSVSKKEKAEINEVLDKQVKKIGKSEAPKTEYKGLYNLGKAADSFNNYDVLHIHAPMFGAASKIISWAKHGKIPVVTTYYRPVKTPDFFSLIIQLYNLYYLPKVFKISSIVASPSAMEIDRLAKLMLRKHKEKLLEIDSSSVFYDLDLKGGIAVKLETEEYLAGKYVMVYNNLIKK